MTILGDRVLISEIKGEEITQSGIIIPEKDKKYRTGKVQQLGKKVKHIKVGDVVQFYDHVGANINYRGDDLILLSEETDVICRL
jgi:co-chaperonin GroES (HSP10)